MVLKGTKLSVVWAVLKLLFWGGVPNSGTYPLHSSFKTGMGLLFIVPDLFLVPSTFCALRVVRFGVMIKGEHWGTLFGEVGLSVTLLTCKVRPPRGWVMQLCTSMSPSSALLPLFWGGFPY